MASEPQPQPQPQTVQDAVERVNTLKRLVGEIIGDGSGNYIKIESKLQSLKDKIQQLASLKTELSERIKLLKESYENASELLKSTDDITQLFDPMNRLKTQIEATIDFSEGDLDTTITDLGKLIQEEAPRGIMNSLVQEVQQPQLRMSGGKRRSSVNKKTYKKTNKPTNSRKNNISNVKRIRTTKKKYRR